MYAKFGLNFVTVITFILRLLQNMQFSNTSMGNTGLFNDLSHNEVNYIKSRNMKQFTVHFITRKLNFRVE
jgi:hypothetical protein